MVSSFTYSIFVVNNVRTAFIYLWKIQLNLCQENFVMLCPLHRDSNLPVETPELQKQGNKRRASKGYAII
jgi:hypothetical protein